MEFQKVMYGYGAEKASESIRRWQAKAGYEAGQCAGLLASQQRNNSSRRKQIDAAKKYFTYVVRTHPKSKEANAAGQQLKKYSRL